MTSWGKVYKTLQALSSMTGFAVGNLTRDAVAIWNTAVARDNDAYRVKTYDGGAKAIFGTPTTTDLSRRMRQSKNWWTMELWQTLMQPTG